VTVSDGKGGTITKFVDIEVVAKPEYHFDDILFAFDKSTLDAAAIKLLTKDIQVLNEHPELTLVIEGHTGSIGTNQYNMGPQQASRAVGL
jgi:outer membrane protein OmpA-like peptidoglycan-associated protein